MLCAGDLKIGENGAHSSALNVDPPLLPKNDWNDPSSAIAYIPANPDAGQTPSLAEVLDADGDGTLTPNEYSSGRNKLGAFKLPEEFSSFKGVAALSVQSPMLASSLGTANIVTPGMTAAEREAEKKAAYQVAWALIDRAKEQEYGDARQTLLTAGQIFGQFGYTAESSACQTQLAKRAEEAVNDGDEAIKMIASADLQFLKGLTAIQKGDVAEVREIAGKLPPWYADGKAVLNEFLANYDKAERVEKLIPTLVAAKAIRAWTTIS